MGTPLRARRGGITGLLAQPREVWDALEADLLNHGFTLDDYPHRLSLRAIRHFMFWSRPESALYRLQHGAAAGWAYTQELLAGILEALQDANWQRAGNRTAPRPKPVQRPGQAPPEGTQHFTGEPVSIAEFNRRMAERSAA